MKNKKTLRRKNYKKLSKKNSKIRRGGSMVSQLDNGTLLIPNMALRDAISDFKKKEEVPDYFLCPITGDIMEDPVICIDGYTYERNAIEKWLQNNHTSPMTRQSLVPPAQREAQHPPAAMVQEQEQRERPVIEWRRGERVEMPGRRSIDGFSGSATRAPTTVEDAHTFWRSL